uniref:E-beta-farnesene synthase n=1 Tax=Tanacetum cinerariifolium TaxID=118510 RepID=A0A6L2MJW5_TANCI|nr:E-beta-farnesene synthase [Tanacetum cinerariifolium]
MVDVNVNAPVDQAPTMAPPTRTDDQILPHIRWLPIGKSNCYLDVEKSQSNQIYKITVDILKHTNFFRAFTASLTIPSIYIQQFWDTVRYDKTVGCYKCQLDEQWFDLTKDTLRDALQITPVNDNKRKHKFHPRPDFPFHFPNEEPVLGYLKFSAKGTKREVFGMPIPGNLITADIQGKPYYQEYLEKVAKHQRYLVGEKRSDPDSPVPKPAKATKKSKMSAPKADLRPPVTKPASSQQPEPKPTPAKSKGKKRKLVTETSDKSSPARRSRPGLVTKRRKPTSSLRSVDESVAEGIPEKEPRFDDEEADVQRELEESLKSIYDAPRGPLPSAVIREPERTSTPTGSSGHDESSSLYVELGLTDSEVESDEDVPRMDAGVQDEGQAGPNPSEQDEGQAGPNPTIDVSTQPHPEQIDKGFTATTYPKDLFFGDLFFNDKPSEADNEKTTMETKAESMVSVTIQQDMSSIPPMTTPIIDLTSRLDSLNVHRPLQATETETTTTTTTHPPPPQPQQSTTDSMLMKRIGKLENIMANLIQDNKHLEERLDSYGVRLYTLENLDIPQQVSKAMDEIVTDAVDLAIQAPLRNHFRDLPEADMKEILHQRMWETNSYKTNKDHIMLYEALENSMNHDHTKELLKDLAEARKKKKKRRDSPKTPHGSPPHQPPPPPPPVGPSRTSRSLVAFGSSQVLSPPPPPTSTNQEGQSHGSVAPTSSKTAASAEYKAWIITNTRLRPFVSSTPEDLQMDDDMALDAQVHSFDDEDIENAHIPKNNWASALASTYSPPPEDSLLAQISDMAMFMDRFYKRQGITKLKPQDLEGLAFELVKVFHPNVIHLQYQMQECYKLLTDSVDG